MTESASPGSGLDHAQALQVVQDAHRRYAEAFDARSPDAVAAAFTDAGVLVTSTGVTVATRTELRNFAASWVASRADAVTRHSCDGHDVTTALDRIISTCRAVVEEIAPDGTRSVLLRATYADTLALQGGRWLIARRVVMSERAH